MAAPQPVQSPNRSRGFSVKSEQSNTSSKSGHKSHQSESSQEKARRNLHTKADPLIAMNELQPNRVALEKSNLGSLREMEHKDQFGNVITDPDWSNPTRPRFERPLDTIKSFEAAIYGAYSSNRHSYAKTDDAASQMGDYSRRTSYYGPNGHSNRGYDQNGHIASRAGPSRPDSVVDNYQGQAPENHYPYQNGRRQRHHPRASNEQAGYNANGYSQPAYQRSYDNVAAMSGSGYIEPYGQATDPSSLNSSMDQLQQQAMQQHRLDERAQAEYGFQGFGAGPNLAAKGQPSAPAGSSWGGSSQAPAVNRLTKTANTATPPNNDKRKSWFKRRFSKD